MTTEQEKAYTEDEWSGQPDPDYPDDCWIDDLTGEHISAETGERTQAHTNVA